MLGLFAAAIAVVYVAEANGSPAQQLAGRRRRESRGQGGRASVSPRRRCSHPSRRSPPAARSTPRFDSLTGIGGLVPMFNMSTGEVVFGGVGSGLYGMLLFVLLAVFIAGLMVGRTPEYLGKKIEAREIKLVMVGTLLVPLMVLVATALAIGTKWGAPSIYNPGPAGLLRDALRLHLAGQQQRLGVRRLHRLRAAQRARQRRRVRDHLRRPARRRGDAARSLRADGRRARGRRRAGAASGSRRSAPARSAPTPRPSSRCSSSRS